MFVVTAWTSIGLDEYCEVVPAKSLSVPVENLVERAKSGLIDQVAAQLNPPA